MRIKYAMMASSSEDLDVFKDEAPTFVEVSGSPYMALLEVFKTSVNLIAASLVSGENLKEEERVPRQIELIKEITNDFFEKNGKTEYDLEQEKNK
jgi:hypothetical protein